MKTIEIYFNDTDVIKFDCQDVLIKDGMLLVIQKEKTLGFNISIVHEFTFYQKVSNTKKRKVSKND